MSSDRKFRVRYSIGLSKAQFVDGLLHVTWIRFILDSVARVGHNLSQDFDLFRIVGLGPSDVDFNLARVAKDLLGVVSPRLPSQGYKVIAVHQSPDIPSWVVKTAKAGGSSDKPSLGERCRIMLTPPLGGVEGAIHDLL